MALHVRGFRRRWLDARYLFRPTECHMAAIPGTISPLWYHRAYGVQVSSLNPPKSKADRIENGASALLVSAQPFQHAAL